MDLFLSVAGRMIGSDCAGDQASDYTGREFLFVACRGGNLAAAHPTDGFGRHIVGAVSCGGPDAIVTWVGDVSGSEPDYGDAGLYRTGVF